MTEKKLNWRLDYSLDAPTLPQDAGKQIERFIGLDDQEKISVLLKDIRIAGASIRVVAVENDRKLSIVRGQLQKLKLTHEKLLRELQELDGNTLVRLGDCHSQLFDDESKPGKRASAQLPLNLDAWYWGFDTPKGIDVGRPPEYPELNRHYNESIEWQKTIDAYLSSLTTVPKGRPSDNSLQIALEILQEAYTCATDRRASANASRFIDFLQLIGPWIELPDIDLTRHLKKIGTK